MARHTLRFEGREIEASPGQSIAGALHAAGVRTLSWSAKYRRPRGLRCGTGVCPGCTLAVDGLGGVQACMTPVLGGEEVRRIRPWLPWLPADRLGRFTPAGFQGSRWLRSPRVWSVAERVLARLALGAPIPRPAPDPSGRGSAGFEARTVDLLVIGAGETGLRAAAEAAQAGRTVLLVDRDTEPGGRLLGEPGGREKAGHLAGAARDAGAEILVSAVALGRFDDGAEGVEGVALADRLIAVTAAETRRATGSLDREVVLPDGDRPGVMLPSAVRRLIVREGVQPGRRAVLVERGDADPGLVALLAEAGTAVVGRCSPADVEAIHGRAAVEGITIRSVRVPCDVLVVAAGRRPADELARQLEVPEEPRPA